MELLTICCGAIFAIPGVGGVERKDGKVPGFKSHRLVTKIIEGAQEETGAAEQQDAECNLRADGKFAEALRIAGEGSGILPHGSGEIGADEMKDRSDAEKQCCQNREPQREEAARAYRQRRSRAQFRDRSW